MPTLWCQDDVSHQSQGLLANLPLRLGYIYLLFHISLNAYRKIEDICAKTSVHTCIYTDKTHHINLKCSGHWDTYIIQWWKHEKDHLDRDTSASAHTHTHKGFYTCRTCRHTYVHTALCSIKHSTGWSYINQTREGESRLLARLSIATVFMKAEPQ